MNGTSRKLRTSTLQKTLLGEWKRAEIVGKKLPSHVAEKALYPEYILKTLEIQ